MAEYVIEDDSISDDHNSPGTVRPRSYTRSRTSLRTDPRYRSWRPRSHHWVNQVSRLLGRIRRQRHCRFGDDGHCHRGAAGGHLRPIQCSQPRRRRPRSHRRDTGSSDFLLVATAAICPQGSTTPIYEMLDTGPGGTISGAPISPATRSQ